MIEYLVMFSVCIGSCMAGSTIVVNHYKTRAEMLFFVKDKPDSLVYEARELPVKINYKIAQEEKREIESVEVGK